MLSSFQVAARILRSALIPSRQPSMTKRFRNDFLSYLSQNTMSTGSIVGANKSRNATLQLRACFRTDGDDVMDLLL